MQTLNANIQRVPSTSAVKLVCSAVRYVHFLNWFIGPCFVLFPHA